MTDLLIELQLELRLAKMNLKTARACVDIVDSRLNEIGKNPVRIVLTMGQVALVSLEDADLADFSWTAQRHSSGDYYAVRSPKVNGKFKKTYLHRVILERILGRSLLKGEECDHIDLNKLDCRRCNLRLSTHTQNNRNKRKREVNKSGYIGVHWHKQIKRWVAYITVDRKRLHLGTFDTAEQAKVARDAAALKYHGEFARFE